jgi:hypothetical protein
MSNLWQSIKDEIRIQLNEFRPFVALAGTQSDGRIRIRRVIEATQGTELYARLSTRQVTVGDEVLCITVGGKPVVLGKLQRSDPGRSTFLTERPSVELAHKAFYVNPGLATATAVGIAAPTLNATAANADDSDGPWVQHTTGTVSGNTSGMQSAGLADVRLQWPSETEFVIKTPSDITNLRLFVGLFSAFPTALSPTAHAAAFRYSSDNSANWRMFINDNSGTGTSFDSGLAVAANTIYRFRITTYSAGDAAWYINDVAYLGAGPGTTDYPSETTLLGPLISVQTLTGASRAVKWSRVSMMHTP